MAHTIQTDESIDSQQCTKQQALNLHECLPQQKLGSSSDQLGFAQQSLCGMSLAQLMSQHVQKSKVEGDNGRSFGLSSLSTLTKGSISPSSIMCNQNSLSLGTLASLNMSSGAQSSAPSLLSVPLSNLSLNNSITTRSSFQAPSGFSLDSLLSTSSISQSSSGVGGQTKMATPNGSPSLSDLIQEHSNCSSNTKTATAPAQSLSLSELAAQHQGKNTHIQPSNPLSSSVSAASIGEAVSLSELALQNRVNSHSTGSGASSLTEPYASSPAPFAPAGISREGVNNHKPCHRNPRSSKLRQAIDVRAPMEQSDFPSPLYFSDALSSLSCTASVFAKPSMFARALSFQSQGLRRRNMLEGKLHNLGTGSGHQDLMAEQSSPLSPITAFQFDTPSPDDIIRANQRKAFTR